MTRRTSRKAAAVRFTAALALVGAAGWVGLSTAGSAHSAQHSAPEAFACSSASCYIGGEGWPGSGGLIDFPRGTPSWEGGWHG